MRAFLLAAFVAAALAPAPAAAQGKESKEAPLTVATETRPVPAGSAVEIHGKTIAADARRSITLVVTWLRPLAGSATGAAPAAQSLAAPYGTDGAYSASFVPRTEGVYRIDATSPDGSGRASTELRVTGFAAWSADEGKAIAEALDVSSDLVAALGEAVASQPPSPAKDQFLQKLQPLRQKLAERQAAATGLQSAFGFYGRVASEHPALIGALGPLRDTVAKFRSASNALVPQLRAATVEAKRRNRLCEDLVKVEEGFKLLSTMINLVGNSAETLLAFSIDFAAAAAGNRAPQSCTEGCKFAFGQAAKQHEWIRTGAKQAKEGTFAFKAYQKGIPGFLAEALAFATHGLFDQYCDRFEGPVNGSMKVEYTKGGRVWWRYTVKIKGKMLLAYRKGGDAGAVVPVAGHIVGTGTDFAVEEDALRVLFPKLLAGARIVGRTLAPTGYPFVDFAGAMALQSVPSAFFIAVDGTLADGKLQLKLGPARTDFGKDYAVADGRYAIVGGYGGPFVSYTTFDVPFDNARGLIEKATDGDSQPIEIPVTIAKDKMTANAVFAGTRGKGVKAAGEYQLRVQLCNPGC